MKIQNVAYTPSVLLDLFQRADDELKAAKVKSKGTDISFNAGDIHKHIIVVESLTCILESATVFHLGGGYNQKFGSSLEERLESFRIPLVECLRSRKDTDSDSSIPLNFTALQKLLHRAAIHLKTCEAHMDVNMPHEQCLYACAETLSIIETHLYGTPIMGESLEGLKTRIRKADTTIQKLVK